MIRFTKLPIALLALLLSGGALSAQETPPTPPTPATPAVPATPSSEWSSKSSYLGVMVNDVTSDRLAALKLKEESGVEVTVVDHDGPAFKAGMKEHDVILAFNGTKVESVEELRRLIRETPANRKVTLGLMREGQPVNLDVTLASRQQVYAMNPRVTMPKIVIPPMRVDVPNFYMVYSSRAGLSVENLTPQLGSYFGVKDGNGILIRSVDDGSAAANAGFKAGDVILKAGDAKVTDQGDWRNALRDNRGKKMPVVILRDHREQTLTLDVPGRESSENSFEINVPTMDPAEMKALGEELKGMEVDMSDLTVAELSKHQVEMQHAMREAQRQLRLEMRNHRRELQKQQKELQKQHKELHKQLQEQHKQLKEEELQQKKQQQDDDQDDNQP